MTNGMKETTLDCLAIKMAAGCRPFWENRCAYRIRYRRAQLPDSQSSIPAGWATSIPTDSFDIEPVGVQFCFERQAWLNETGAVAKSPTAPKNSIAFSSW